MADKEIIVYSKSNCPGCEQAKAKLTAEGKLWREVKVGVDIDIDEFITLYPDVRTVPFIVYPD